MKPGSLAVTLMIAMAVSQAMAGSLNGRAGTMPALYDGELFTINLKELPDDASLSLVENNGSINTIYVSEDLLPGGEPFVAVLDAIQGDGFNPLWLEVEISFTAGTTPRQLESDDDVADALANGEITVSSEGEVYRCSVIGPQ